MPENADPMSALRVGDGHTIEARGDEYPAEGGSLPIESGGWWTPYVETSWGYFRFAVHPVEQPDGVILFWHDAEGAHSQSVVTEPDAPSLEGARHPEAGETERLTLQGWSLDFDAIDRWLVLTDPDGAAMIVAKDVDLEYGGDIAGHWRIAERLGHVAP